MRRYDSQDARRRVLAACARLFLDRGYTRTRMADILREAYRLDDRPEFTDDASRVEACGHEIYLYEGSPENIKVTVPGDFKIAEALLG